jgi:hypothetical protein
MNNQSTNTLPTLAKNHQPTRRILLCALTIIGTLMVAPIARVDHAEAAPSSACNRAREGRTASADGAQWICKRLGTRSARYAWVLLRLQPIGPGGTVPPRPSTSTTTTRLSGIPGVSNAASTACLIQGTGYWENADAAYWQNVLNQKVDGVTNALFLYQVARKGYNFLSDGTMVVVTEFVFKSVDLRSGMTSSSTSLFSGHFHVAGEFIVIDSVEQDDGEVVVTFPGGAVPPRRTPGASRLTVGYQMPFKCDGNLLAIGEPGLTGNAATTFTRR